jgi:hypothetical protein
MQPAQKEEWALKAARCQVVEERSLPYSQSRHVLRSDSLAMTIHLLSLASVALCRGTYSELLAASLAALVAQCRLALTSVVCF